ncbi:TIGR03013 family PEP-CTERM/XrtA system glycosyltransferase [Siccirubricoccus sp. KC 17139]|uniref:TIGR03013 family PEP-CTERM/XrtA system glycosyltransferase n=1 Tax=Siccirubricoccus soli TaxID=2899147 RepID=A0ABT1D5T9_9PROT|nr:TIGR03013 family XrtA/PEP-CTERM system glycosyltransferase [Siccirubricoccus soli]MCO6417293.1 TIGR03013 family PEP-CTERM/XrtA system glycosyltransferase [Siccirubricoccus soli]MCP2683428.1 TIGR03013 family PEP-CTERM/XrtA system glycosyltransferase [Siccirubricoccus soli]
MATTTRPGLTAGPALLLLDAGLTALAWPAALLVALGSLPDGTRPSPFTLLLYPACYLLFLYALGLYRRDALVETRKSMGRAPLAAVLAALSVAFASAMLPPPLGGPAGAGLLLAALTAFVSAGFASRVMHFVLRRRGAFRRRLLVIGAGQRAWELALLLQREGRTLNYEVTFVHAPGMGEIDPRLAANPDNLILPAGAEFLGMARRARAEQIVVAPDDRRGLDMMALLACRTAGYPVQEYHRFLEKEIGRIDVKRIELGWLVFNDGFSFGPIDLALKRLLDVTASLVLLLLTGPFLLAAMLAVLAEDGAPVLYRQKRVTQGGRLFEILKLRTMRRDAERFGAVWAEAQDPRITRIGRFLRRTRLDELPQLLNVLRGDMSLVGPRPERPEFTRKLAEALPLYEERHLVKAGLTGWAQINYPYGASLDDARSKLSYDLHYVKNQGFLFDLLILAQTLRVVLWPGAGVR